MAVAVETVKQCGTCLFHRDGNRYCSRWKQVVEPTDACDAWAPANAGGPVKVSYVEPVKASRTKQEKPANSRNESGLTPGIVAELIMQGKTQTAIAEEYGTAPGSVNWQVQRAVETGLLRKVGRGQYVAPDEDTETEDQPVVQPEVAQAAEVEEKPVEKSAETEIMREDLIKLEQWALRLDKRHDDLFGWLVDRLTSLALAIIGLEKDLASVEARLLNQIGEVRDAIVAEKGVFSAQLVDRLLRVLDAQQEIIKSQLEVTANADQD